MPATKKRAILFSCTSGWADSALASTSCVVKAGGGPGRRHTYIHGYLSLEGMFCPCLPQGRTGRTPAVLDPLTAIVALHAPFCTATYVHLHAPLCSAPRKWHAK
eukprot:scaffold30042_cov20-Tisochrysis_lutea.AAC.2